jgi:hypothetical protein
MRAKLFASVRTASPTPSVCPLSAGSQAGALDDFTSTCPESTERVVFSTSASATGAPAGPPPGLRSVK